MTIYFTLKAKKAIAMLDVIVTYRKESDEGGDGCGEGGAGRR